MDKSNIEFKIESELGVFDEKGNTSLEMRIIGWNNKEPKLELRKWIVGSQGEQSPNKGFSFLTNDGPHRLTELLVENNYGDTKVIYDMLTKRDDFHGSDEEDYDYLDEEVEEE